MKSWILLGIVVTSSAIVPHADARPRRKSQTSTAQTSNSARPIMTKFVAVLKNGEDKDLLPFISRKGVRVMDDGQRSTITYQEAKEGGLHGFFAPGAMGMNDVFRSNNWRFKSIGANTFAPDDKNDKEKRIYVKWKREGRTWKIEEYAFPLALSG